jgi:hypothetical protein
VGALTQSLGEGTSEERIVFGDEDTHKNCRGRWD